MKSQKEKEIDELSDLVFRDTNIQNNYGAYELTFKKIFKERINRTIIEILKKRLRR